MGSHIHEGDFFEPDEPIEQVNAAWQEATVGGLTGEPTWFNVVLPSSNTGVVSHVPLQTLWLTNEDPISNDNPSHSATASA